MKPLHIALSIIVSTFIVLATPVAAKPLKVYILCGQSNMEGHAQIHTFPAIAKDPQTAAMHKLMVGADGKPAVIDDVWIAYSYGNFSGDPVGKKSGKLTAGFGSQHHVGTGKIGPELTFGIYMNKALNEPILLIKNAWGGKSLMVDFRPPSGGEIADEKLREKAKQKVGKYYQHMMQHVKEVLADPKKVYPDYDAKQGVELAGFVWFQGFNDLVGPYPRTDPTKGKKSTKDYSEYSRLLRCFIRDVRKDLKAPKLPFVVGVLGTGGEEASDGAKAFRDAMATPAGMNEFKGNVVNVFTHKYWPAEIDVVMAKVNAAKAPFSKESKKIKKSDMKPEEKKKAFAEIRAKSDAAIEKALTKEELFIYQSGRSNQGFHYHGSAKFFGQIGKAFADALVDLKKGN
ncbi:MAG: sialate O-acetylesterase [Akkermansiaceae bacterium]